MASKQAGFIGQKKREIAVAAGCFLAIVVLYVGFQRGSAHRSPLLHENEDAHGVPCKPGSLKTISNATLGFGQIFVINMPSRTDHRDAMILSAAVTDLHFDFTDGVRGEDVLRKTIPPGAANVDDQSPTNGNLGSWRAHMNALQAVVQQNLSSALIMEDDADWDVRIKAQLKDFARSSRVLTQPLAANPSKFADVSFPDGIIREEKSFTLGSLPQTVQPSVSAYGDDWDVLWLGHCGMSFPKADWEGSHHPLGRVIHRRDETVAGPPAWDWGEDYPQHTRVIGHHSGGVCSLAYAVSQRGARRILYEFGISDYSSAFDVMLKEFCEDGENGRIRSVCLAVKPALFDHHHPRGDASAESEISGHGGYTQKAWTDKIRWSTRVNLPRILRGEGPEDQYPD